jgi:cob(I)alamin adenosyltransferase
MITPPMNKKGTKPILIKAMIQQKRNDITIAITKVKKDSSKVETISVVNPLISWISSASMLVKTPGARFLLSNHDTSF